MSIGMEPPAGHLAAESSPPVTVMSRRRSVDGLLLLPRPYRVCSCPVSAPSPPLPGTGAHLGEAKRFHLSSANNSKKSESFPELIHILIPQAPGNQPLLISFAYSDLPHLFESGVKQPRLVTYKYKYSHKSLPAPPKLLFCKHCSRSSSSSMTYYNPMEDPSSVDTIFNFWGLPIHTTNLDLRSLVFRVLPQLLGLSPPSSMNILKTPPLLIEATLPELPEDILMRIFATLEIPDLIRAGAVCTFWRSAYTSLRTLGKHKQPQTPCLFYTAESSSENVACLYSLVEKRVYRLTLPEPPLHTRFLIGSSLGLLVTVDERSEMHLVNPITGQQIALPSVTTMQHVKPICDDSGAVHKYAYSKHTAKKVIYPPKVIAPAALREVFHQKALLFYDTPTGSYIVVLIHMPFGQLSFARVGDDKWTWLPPHTDYFDCTYKDGLLYAATLLGEVHTFDLSGPAVTMNTIMGVDDDDLEIQGAYILEAPWGSLLLVWRLKVYSGNQNDISALTLHTKGIKIHEVDVAAKKLVEIDCLHGHVLFLGHNQSLCLSTKECPALKENRVYFTDDNEYIAVHKDNRRDIGLLRLDNNSWESLVFPQLWSNWPAPVWITPNITMMKLSLNN
ncbi:putative F-box protein At4g22660 [Aegilops tauschii subsp. strangulata]|nr:putative F-box protein At4g22660 [Aegilops tauschii subsp. strangulata]